MKKCIDISKHQTAFNATTCANSGVSIVLGRLAYGTTKDTKAIEYIKSARDAGLKIGGYGFATWHYTIKNAGDLDLARKLMKEQVNTWIEVALESKCNSWIGIDQELEKGQEMSFSIEDNTNLLLEAAKMIEDAGLHPCLYASASWVKQYVDLDKFKYPLWIAYYKWNNTKMRFEDAEVTFPADSGTYGSWMNKNKDQICMWQFTSVGYADEYGCTQGSNNVDKEFVYFEPEIDTRYFDKYLGTSGSIVDALIAVEAPSSGYQYRKKIAAANNIKNYIGSASQNKSMLALLKKGLLLKPIG
jgi:GH25 family lysozyme M1 (1,4-beta-N-acetylmuramidase)